MSSSGNSFETLFKQGPPSKFGLGDGGDINASAFGTDTELRTVNSFFDKRNFDMDAHMDSEFSFDDRARYFCVQGRKYKLMPNRKYIIGGSMDGSDIVIDGQVMDEKHALLLVFGDSNIIFMDLKTEFGTFINGERIESLQFVTIEDRADISFGSEIKGEILGRMDPIDPADCIDLLGSDGKEFETLFSKDNVTSGANLSFVSNKDKTGSTSVIFSHRRCMTRKMKERSSGFDSLYDAHAQVSYAGLLKDIEANEALGSRINLDDHYNVPHQPFAKGSKFKDVDALYPLDTLAKGPAAFQIKARELLMGGPRLANDSCLAKGHIGLLCLGNVRQRDMFKPEIYANLRFPEYESSIIKYANGLIPITMKTTTLAAIENKTNYHRWSYNRPAYTDAIEDEMDESGRLNRHRRRYGTGANIFTQLKGSTGTQQCRNICSDESCRCKEGVKCSDSSIDFNNLNERYILNMARKRDECTKESQQFGGSLRLCRGCKRPLPETRNDIYCIFCAQPEEDLVTDDSSSLRSLLGLNETGMFEGMKVFESEATLRSANKQSLHGSFYQPSMDDGSLWSTKPSKRSLRLAGPENIPQLVANIVKFNDLNSKSQNSGFDMQDTPSTSRLARESAKRVSSFLSNYSLMGRVQKRNLDVDKKMSSRIKNDDDLIKRIIKEQEETLSYVKSVAQNSTKSSRSKAGSAGNVTGPKTESGRLAGGQESTDDDKSTAPEKKVSANNNLTIRKPTFSIFSGRKKCPGDSNYLSAFNGSPGVDCPDIEMASCGSLRLYSTYEEALNNKKVKDETVVLFKPPDATYQLQEGANYLVGSTNFSKRKPASSKPHIYEIWIKSASIDVKQLLIKLHHGGIAELVDLRSASPNIVDGIKIPPLGSVFISNTCPIQMGAVHTSLVFLREDQLPSGLQPTTE